MGLHMLHNFARQTIVAAISLALVGGVAFSPARAGSSNGTIGVALNVSAACAVNGGSQTSGSLGQLGSIQFPDQPGTFGNVDATMVASSGGNAISVLCSPGLTPSMTIGSGAHDANSTHYLASGSNQVAYHLYSDSSRNSEITIGQAISLGTASTTALTQPIYARVNSGGQVLAAGAYTDTVQVTLSW
jgi:spore coat protein U-like protein